jgi:uncharacterized membrane protein
MPPRNDRGALALLGVAVLVFVSLAGAMPSVWNGTTPISDVHHYWVLGDRMEGGAVPYRDFDVEYPPGALVAFLVPSLLTSGLTDFGRAFGAGMVLFGIAGICACFIAMRRLGLHGWRIAAGLAPLTAAPLLLGPLVLERFDLYPMLLVTAALTAAVGGRDRLAAGLLGLAIAVKVYPVALVPLAVAWTWRRRGRREALLGLAICITVVVLVFLPFFVLAPGGVASSVGGQLDRPLQIESLGAAVLLAAHRVFGMGLGWHSSHGSDNLTGTVAVVAAVVTSAAQVAALLWIWARFARSARQTERLLVDAAFAVLVVFVAFGKVLSPQFLLWLLPVAALATGRRGLAALAGLAAACGVTRGWFPDRYRPLVHEFDELASWLVLVRDLLLVAVVVLAVLAVRDRSAPARSPLPDR